MKLLQQNTMGPLALFTSWAITLGMATLRSRVTFIDPTVDPRRRNAPRCIFVIWHENALLPVHLFRRTPISVLVSRNRDGEFAARTLAMLGLGAVRGSSNRDGALAMRRLLKTHLNRHLVITPDGPRGPRRIVQPGAIFLASRTGMPIVPCGFGYDRAWVLKRSWDRMKIPVPGSAVYALAGEPIFVPGGLGREGIEEVRGRVQGALDRAQRGAEFSCGHGQQS